mmetsp:Transcript_11744/g.30142  ORF Transcript_11744/g.30142 Transcript_11744/m.30142 type:complete len:252 (-) Transcript_11744:635-1390(-)
MELEVAAESVVLALRPRRVAAGLLAGFVEPVLVPRHRQELAVAEARLPDAAHADVQVVAVLRELRLRRRQRDVIEAEVHVVWLALRFVLVVRLGREPLKVEDDDIDRILLFAKPLEGRLDIVAILPAPAGGDEAEGVPREHCWLPGQRVVGLRPLLQRGCGHEVELVLALEGPRDVGTVRAVRGREMREVRLLGNAKRRVAVRGVVVGHIAGSVADHRIRRRSRQLVCVQRARAPTIQLPVCSGELQRQRI